MLMHSQGKTQTEIAQALGRSASAISRELKRYSLAEYRASLAHSSYQAHRKRCKATPKLQQLPYRRLIFGHREADTVLGKSGGACLVMLTDRKSRFELAKKVARKKAELVKKAMIGSGQTHILFI